MAFALLIIGPLLVVPLDLALWDIEWGATWRPRYLTRVPGAVLATAFLVALPVNAWVVNRLAASRRPEVVERGWLRLALWTSATLPLLGLMVIAVWRWLVVTRPSWAFSRRREALPLRFERHEGDRFVRRSGTLTIRHRWLGLAWLLVGNFLLLFVTAQWFAAPSPVPPARQPILLGLSVAVHGLLGVLAGIYLGLKSGGPHKLRVRTPWIPPICLLWLGPILGPLLGVVLIASLETEGRRARTLTFAGFVEGSKVTRSPLWRRAETVERLVASRLRDGLFNVLGVVSTNLVERATSAVRLESFCRFKTLLLWADGAALGAVLALGWRRAPSLELMWKGLWAGSLLLVLLSVLGVVVLRVSVFLGRMLPSLSDKLQARNKRSSSLTVVGPVRALVTCCCGLFAGFPLALGDPRVAGYFLSLAALVWSVFLVIRVLRDLLPRHGKAQETARQTATWLTLLLILQGSGVWMVLDEAVAARLAGPLLVIVFLSPVLHLLLARRSLGWLLRPVGFRDLVSPALSIAVRAVLVVTVMAAYLPFGGLLVPGLPALRRRVGLPELTSTTPG